MSPNLWQYLVLLEGIGAMGTAAGLAQESLRRNPANLVGYANIGVLLICASLVANIVASLEQRPTLATWIAAAGFGLYAFAVVGVWASAARVFHQRSLRQAMR